MFEGWNSRIRPRPPLDPAFRQHLVDAFSDDIREVEAVGQGSVVLESPVSESPPSTPRRAVRLPKSTDNKLRLSAIAVVLLIACLQELEARGHD
jgi:hypothetical protein